jgi:hypothetical protein
MSKEHITYPSRQLTPEHLDALYLLNLFVNAYDEHRHSKRSSVEYFDFINSMDVFRKECKNYGF